MSQDTDIISAQLARFRDDYQAAITRLEQIQAAVNPTNAQVIQAVKDLAKYQEIIIKFIARTIIS